MTKKQLFTDIHNHIIFEFDDGPASFDEVKRMLEMALEQNTGHIFATSHFQEFVPQPVLEDYYDKLEKIKNYIVNRNLNIRVYPGAEIFFHDGLENNIHNYSNYILNEQSNYILFEYPMFQNVTNYGDIIFKLRLKGIRPLIAHPERYRMIYENLDTIYKLIKMGALIQMNAGSILGHFGKPVKEIAHSMLKKQLVHVVASDAHNSGSRRFLMKDAYNYCSGEFPDLFVNEIFYSNPARILKNEDIEPRVAEPEEARRSIKKKIYNLLKFNS